MKPKENDLENLAQRVKEGDFQAKAQLQQHLEPSLVRIVRRVLERGAADSALERKILVAAQRLSPGLPGPNDPRTVPLAHNLCQMVISRLWPGRTEAAWPPTVSA